MPNSNFGMLFEPPSGEVFVPPIGNVGRVAKVSKDEAVDDDVKKNDVETQTEYDSAPRQYSQRNIQTHTSREIASSNREIVNARVRQPQRHYLKEAFQTQGTSLAQCARKMGISVEQALRQMEPDYNLTLSQMFAWSEALDVPLPELLPFDSRTSDPIRNRGLLLRIVKTARTIQNLSYNTPVQYAAQTLVDQLIELIPEYASVEPWPTVGKSRAAKSEGVISQPIEPNLSRLIEEHS